MSKKESPDEYENADEIYRLREIIDALNKRIEELKIIVSKEDEQSIVSRSMLMEKNNIIEYLRKEFESYQGNDRDRVSSNSK